MYLIGYEYARAAADAATGGEEGEAAPWLANLDSTADAGGPRRAGADGFDARSASSRPSPGAALAGDLAPCRLARRPGRAANSTPWPALGWRGWSRHAPGGQVAADPCHLRGRLRPRPSALGLSDAADG